MVTILNFELTTYSDFNNIEILHKTKLNIDKGTEMRLSLYDKYKLGMKKLSITQNKLALEMGFTRSYVNMLVNGKRKNDQFDNWVKENILPLFETKRSIKK